MKLAQPGPLTAGMKVDVYFSQDKAAARAADVPAKESKN